MENPATWGEAERVVDRILRQWTAELVSGRLVGLSLARRITDALRDAGLIPEFIQAQNEEKEGRGN